MSRSIRLVSPKQTMVFIGALFLAASSHAANYQNFRVAVYARAYEVVRMKDPAWLETSWATITNGMKVDKIYLETHRDGIIPDQETLDRAKQFFKSKGVETAGGIATVVNERNRFETFVYTNPEHRKKMQEIAEYTAKNFDEIIIDDFFFTSSKTESDIQAKGDKTWTRFRLDLMAEVSRNVLVGPAKKANPRVKMIIKYPNWYEHYQYNGYNLEEEPRIFDGIYTGAETRDPQRGNQHLQQYLGYGLTRYFENIKPGHNGGAWVDEGGWRDNTRFEEQIWLPLFAKAREITLFDFRQVLQPVRMMGQGGPQAAASANPAPPVTVPSVAGAVFRQVDAFSAKLGNPVGVKSYKPYHSSGEDFLHDFMGMIGVPMEMVPEFPTGAPTVFLTESAKFDPAIVSKMKKQMMGGGKVVITSGLLRALQGKGIEDIAEIEYTDHKALVRDFPGGFGGGGGHVDMDIVIPEIRYATNDAWDISSTSTRGIGYPMLVQSSYGKGSFYVLTIPDNFGDLYNLPPQVLNNIRTAIASDLPARVEGPSQVGLFVYDNNTLIVDNFTAPGGATAATRVLVDKKFTKLLDLVSGQQIAAGPARGDKAAFDVPVPAASYRVLSAVVN